jgi:hypothetical protein
MRSDTTTAGRRNLPAILSDVCSRIMELIGDRPEVSTVRDVLVRLIEQTAGPVPTLGPLTTTELVNVWSRAVDALCEASTPDDVLSKSIADAVMCEHDLRTALDVPGARDDVSVKVALDEFAGRFSDRVVEAGLPPLRVTVEQWGTIAGDGPASACVVADRFEFVRAMAGRRSAAEICRWNWSDDPKPYLAVISETGLPVDDVRERDPRVPEHMRDREFVL